MISSVSMNKAKKGSLPYIALLMNYVRIKITKIFKLDYNQIISDINSPDMDENEYQTRSVKQ